ncbi:MAG: DUF6049 family protein [Ornithinimicrobium sp.]|uniref:DUF6049 family protein n=1 Tax=Ornithinimicrobium sp. TaxID=1977084 RepID=UPI003D9BD91A
MLVLVLALLLVLLTGALPARADGTLTQQDETLTAREGTLTQQNQETLPVLVELDAVDPAVLGPGVPFVVQGTIRNVSTSEVPVRAVRAETAYRSLDTRGAVAAWATGDAGVTTSRVLATDITDAVLAPGDSRSFTLRIEGDGFEPPFDFATLPLSVQVQAADGTVRGRIRSYLPWYAAERAEQPLRLSWVVPLTKPAQPQVSSADPTIRDDAWLRAIGEESRARVWLEGLTESDSAATFLVDPALLAPLPPVGEMTDPVPAPLPTPTATGEPSTAPPTEQPSSTKPEPDAPSTTRPGDPGSTDTAGAADEGPVPATPPVPTPPVPTPEPTSPEDTPEDPGSPGLPGVNLPEVLTEVQQAQVDLQTRLSELGPDRVWWLPAGDPDLAALLDLQATPSLADQLIPGELPESPLVAGRLVDNGRHDIAWPSWNRVNAADLEALRRLWPQGDPALSAALVPDTAVRADDFTGTTGGAVQVPWGGDTSNSDSTGRDDTEADLTLLAFDTTLSGLVAAAPPPQRDGAVIQRLVAETMAIYQQAPARTRTVLLAPPRQAAIAPQTLADLTAALDQAPWLTQVSAVEALQAPAPARLTGTPLERPAPGDRTAYPVPGPSPLSGDRLSDIETLRTTLLEVSGILPSDQAVQRWQPVLDGLYSTRWRASPDFWSIPLTELQSQVEEVQRGLRVNPTTVNFLADEGLIQTTVVNNLATDVQDLVLHLEPTNGRLRVIEPPEPISIGARSRATVQFRAQAVAAGEVPIRAYLTTPSGLRVGETQELSVRVRPTGEWIYWVLGGAAGVILILGLSRAVRRPGANGADDPADAGGRRR